MQTNAPGLLAHMLRPGWEFASDSKIAAGDDVFVYGEIQKVVRIDPWPHGHGVAVTEQGYLLPLSEGYFTERRIPEETA